MNDRTAKLVTFGQGGDTVHLAGEKHPAETGFNVTHATIEGYGSPERPHAANPAECNIPDGTPAVDLREAVKTKEGFDWVFKGPLVDVDIPEGDAKPLTLQETDGPIAAALAANSATFGALLAFQATKGKERGPLDSVSVAEYIDGWKRHGARIGHYEKGRIVWHG